MWGACPPYASIANASFQNEFFHLSAHLNDGTEGASLKPSSALASFVVLS